MYDFSKHLFRCSSWGHLFTDPQGKSNLQKYNEAVEKATKLKAEYDIMPDKTQAGKDSASKFNKLQSLNKQLNLVTDLLIIKDQKEMSLTAKKHCLDVFTANQYGLHTNIMNRALEKGTVCEEDSITLYSRVKKQFFKNNKVRLTNSFIQGEPDLFTGNTIASAESIIDIKTSWNGISFHRTLAEDIKDIYYYQLQGYMWLTGARSASVAYCLVNTPAGLIEQAKKRLWYDLGCPDETSDLFNDCCNELERSMIYNHIPLEEKIIEFTCEYDEQVIEQGKDRISDARKYLVELQKERLQINKAIEQLTEQK